MDLKFKKNVDASLARIKNHIRRTPVQFSHYLSSSTGSDVYLKLENYQITGSFKARGALNKMTLLLKQKPEKIITASSGNHGSAVAYASSVLAMKTLIFLPDTVSAVKLNNINQYGAQVHIGGNDTGKAERAARVFANEHDYPYLSPYNDYDVIAGQGTAGAEIGEQIRDVDAVFIAVGGGGLITGIGAYLKLINPNIQVIA